MVAILDWLDGMFPAGLRKETNCDRGYCAVILPDKHFPWVHREALAGKRERERKCVWERGNGKSSLCPGLCLFARFQDRISDGQPIHRFGIIPTVFNSRKLCKSIFAEGKIESVLGTFSQCLSLSCLVRSPGCTLLYCALPPRGRKRAAQLGH